MIMENYPKLGSGTKYYEKLNEYVNESGLTFDYTKEPNISDFLKFIKIFHFFQTLKGCQF